MNILLHNNRSPINHVYWWLSLRVTKQIFYMYQLMFYKDLSLPLSLPSFYPPPPLFSYFSLSPWLLWYTHEGCFYHSMCHSPLLSLFSLVLKLSHVYQCETFHTSSRVLCYSPLMLPCFLVGDVPGSPGALPAPTWNQLFYRILPVGLILSFPADKQLHILSPCSSHNLIFFPGHSSFAWAQMALCLWQQVGRKGV